MRMQPMVIGHHYMASAGQYLATEAAHAILHAGGNAVDAGVAGGIALGVVHSDQVQFSGVAPMLIYLADRDETVSIAGLGGWPQGARRRRRSSSEHGGTIPSASCAPSCRQRPTPGSWRCERYGTMSFGEVAAAAIRYAREGFAMHPVMAHFIADSRGLSRAGRRTPRSTSPTGAPPREGERFVQADLAPHDPVHGRRGAGGGAAAAATPACARRATPSIAATSRRRSSRYHRENGGLLTAEDLAELPVRDRARRCAHVRRHRGLQLRSVVPGAGAAADAVAARATSI